MERKPIIVLLAGPTASGKSKIAIKLSKVLDGEIVNADSMQVYKELKILTSRPSSSDLRKIKHHLYGFVSVKKKFFNRFLVKYCHQKNRINFKEKESSYFGWRNGSLL